MTAYAPSLLNNLPHLLQQSECALFDQELKGLMEFDDFAKASAQAKSTADLDVAAQHFAKLAARLTANSALIGAGAATAKAVPLATNTLRSVGETAREAGASAALNPTAVVTAGKARVTTGAVARAASAIECG